MEQFQGKAISGGIAIGTLRLFARNDAQVKRVKITDTESEIARFETARKEAIEQLHVLYTKAVSEVGEANAAVFDTHAMMLEDEDYTDSVYNIIRTQEVNAEYATAMTGDNFFQMFSAMEEEYFRARAADIKDVSDRVIRILSGSGESSGSYDEPVIIAADDLSPSETVNLDKSKVLSFVTRKGSGTSHTAILARSMGIPALIGIPVEETWNGTLCIVDGTNGKFYLDPDRDTLKKLHDRQQEELHKKELLQQLKGKENVTLDGKVINVFSNIGSPADVANVLQNDSGGIGLFRSEFLYLEKDHFPTEEEQFQAYKQVAENMAGRKVVIRTLDIGADKQVDYFDLAHEDNPAMGLRAIRICLTRPEIFKTQLRALFRASMYGTISIMYPMIISVQEVREIHAIVAEVKQELRDAQIPFKDVEEGIMIETPASVIISEELAKEVDFFSIGTNDLTQYTLACDRQNPNLGHFFNPHHEAVLRMIQMTIENGHKGGCWVGICGELGADLSLTETFLKMGVDELSVSSSMILPLRERIRSLRIS